MQLSEVVNSGYRLFDNFGEEEKKKQIESVKWLRFLCVEEAIPEDAVNVLEVIGTGAGNRVYVDKNEINKRFVAMAASRAPSAIRSELVAMEAEIKAKSKSVVDNVLVRKTTELKNSIQYHLRQAQDYVRAYENERTNAVKLELELKALQAAPPPDLMGMILSIEKAGFFKFLHFDGENMIFETKDAVMSYRNVAAGIDGEYNFGQFKVLIHPITCALRIKAWKNNKIYPSNHDESTRHRYNRVGYMWPFSSYGNLNNWRDICLGNVQIRFRDLLKKVLWSEAMALIQSLMTRYDSQASPYLGFEIWNMKSEDRRNIGYSHDPVWANCEKKYLDGLKCEDFPLDLTLEQVNEKLVKMDLDPINENGEDREFVMDLSGQLVRRQSMLDRELDELEDLDEELAEDSDYDDLDDEENEDGEEDGVDADF